MGCLTVHAIHRELAHALPTAGMLRRGLLRALPAVLLQPGAALGGGRGQAHGHHHVGAQGLHLHTLLLERGSQGHDGQRAAAKSAVGFGETPAGGTEVKVTQSGFFLPFFFPPQLLSVLPCQQSEHLSNEFKYICGVILTLRKGLSGFFLLPADS